MSSTSLCCRRQAIESEKRTVSAGASGGSQDGATVKFDVTAYIWWHDADKHAACMHVGLAGEAHAE